MSTGFFRSDDFVRAEKAQSVINQARKITDVLAEALAVMEVGLTPVSLENAHRAIASIWTTVVNDVQGDRANVSSQYLASIHKHLATAAGILNAGEFTEAGLPVLPDGTRERWTRFVQESRYHQPNHVEEIEEVYALAQLRWGEHVRTFALTLGWFAMNILRLVRRKCAIYPPLADRGRLEDSLMGAGPNWYDAESLRGLMDEYEGEQSRAC